MNKQMTFDGSELELDTIKENSVQVTYTSEERDLRKEGRRIRHRIYKWAVYTVSIVFSVLFIVYFLHLILPTDWRWLAAEDLGQIRNLVISIAVGVAANLAGGHFTK